MRVERLSDNQFKIFLTFDDLIERGFTKEELWTDVTSVRDLFTDMMHEASFELGVELEGMLLVQVQMMQAQGMHVYVTQKEESNVDDDEFIEMKVTLDESNELIFRFEDFENIIQAAKSIDKYTIENGQIYLLDKEYYLYLDEIANEKDKENIIAILSEFSTPSIVTIHTLREYAIPIMPDSAIPTIKKYFHTRK
ncbi:MAG TPA: genetic competence negative regulator [Candidatus Avamphibacillus intestinigallinarum]|nr:genetic competence negative regulator [Candidatus Avamphibacillus intestinigallinarum]